MTSILWRGRDPPVMFKYQTNFNQTFLQQKWQKVFFNFKFKTNENQQLFNFTF
jgi:hypothetical protein